MGEPTVVTERTSGDPLTTSVTVTTDSQRVLRSTTGVLRSTARPSTTLVLLLALLTVVAATSLRFAVAETATGPLSFTSDDLLDLAVAPGYTIEVDSYGFELPSAIAFVPEPGDQPDSPVYFVAELQGGIKVVTRDRSVHDFGAVPTWGRQGHDLEGASQQGLAGLCLDADSGYVFATYTEPDEGGVLRNRIVRFDSEPGVFSLAAAAATEMAPILATAQSAPAHQIGGCTVHDGELYVGVGDGGNPRHVTNPDVLLGKVLCMSLDGSPCRERSFGDDGAAAYVYAVGFRNPFGLVWQGGQLHAIENGINLDRFLPVTAGGDHLWDGNDESIASLASILFPNAFAPVQLDYVPTGLDFVAPDWDGHFVAAGYGSRHAPSGVALFGGAAADNRVATPPRYLIEYQGPVSEQHFSGVALGHDGIYAVPMLPIAGTSGAVLKVRYDPRAAHPVIVDKASGLFRGNDLPHLTELGCTSCHSIAGQGGDIGPTLDRFTVNWRITEFLNSDTYERHLATLIAPGSSTDPETVAILREVLAETGFDRTWTWLGHMLANPDFDGIDRQMPNLELTQEQIDDARSELFSVMGLRQSPNTRMRIVSAVRAQWKAVVVGAVLGAIALTLSIMIFEFAWHRRKARRMVPTVLDAHDGQHQRSPKHTAP